MLSNGKHKCRRRKSELLTVPRSAHAREENAHERRRTDRSEPLASASALTLRRGWIGDPGIVVHGLWYGELLFLVRDVRAAPLLLVRLRGTTAIDGGVSDLSVRVPGTDESVRRGRIGSGPERYVQLPGPWGPGRGSHD